MNELCIDGGTRHSWGREGLDVHNNKLVWSRRCIYCRTEKRRRYRGWLRGPNGKVKS